MLFCFTAAILDYIILVCINRGYHCQIFAFLSVCDQYSSTEFRNTSIDWIGKKKLWNFGFIPALNMLERWKVWWWYTRKGKVRNMVCIQRIKPLSFLDIRQICSEPNSTSKVLIKLIYLFASSLASNNIFGLKL